MSEFLDREILTQLKQLNILTRVNNILLSKFILQLQTVKKELHLPKIESFTRFEILDEEYQSLIEEFGRKDTDNALYWLDRQMARNKVNCPHNIKKYIKNKLKKKQEKRNSGEQEED